MIAGTPSRVGRTLAGSARLWVLIGVAFTVGGCGATSTEDANTPTTSTTPPGSSVTTSTGDPSALLGTWLLEEVTLDGAPYELDETLTTGDFPGVAGWVRFEEDGRFFGEGPCDDLQGAYRVDGPVLLPASATTTAARCDPPVIMEAEGVILRPFGNDAVEVAFTGPDVMTIRAEIFAGDAVLRFHRSSES